MRSRSRSRFLTKEYCRYEQCGKRSLIAREIPPERHWEKAGGAGRFCTQRPLQRKSTSGSKKKKKAQQLFTLESSPKFVVMMYVIKHGEAQSD